MEGEITCLFIRTGSMALGCRMCLNSFRETLVRITIRIHFKPPVVLPAHAPISMMMVSSPHKTGGGKIGILYCFIVLALNLVEIQLTLKMITWNKDLRKDSSIPMGLV